jgi:hypothetical protein
MTPLDIEGKNVGELEFDKASKKLNKDNYHVLELTEDYWIFIMFLKFKFFTE